jgi:hypothetical protein
MRLLYYVALVVVIIGGVTGCAPFQQVNDTQPRPQPTKPEAPKPEPPKQEPSKQETPKQDISQSADDAEALIQYATYLRRLNAADLNRELDAMKLTVAKSKSDVNRAQLAMAYALPGLASRDDTRALAMLDTLAKEATSTSVRSFSLMLLSLVADNRRLDESVQTLSAKLKEEQKQSAELQQKLEALKSIEKSLSDRDRGKATAPKK